MRIRVLYFAQAREMAEGKSQEVIVLEQDATSTQLLSIIKEKYSMGNSHARLLSLSINQRIARRDTALKDGDEVALLPPVAGG